MWKASYVVVVQPVGIVELKVVVVVVVKSGIGVALGTISGSAAVMTAGTAATLCRREAIVASKTTAGP